MFPRLKKEKTNPNGKKKHAVFVTLRFSLTNCCFLDYPHFLSWYHTNSQKMGWEFSMTCPTCQVTTLCHPTRGRIPQFFWVFFCFLWRHSCLKGVQKILKLRVWSQGIWFFNIPLVFTAFLLLFFARFFVDKVHNLPPCKADQSCYESPTLQASKASSGLNPLLTTTSNSPQDVL